MTTSVSVQEAIERLADAFPVHPLDPEHAFDEWGGTYLSVDDFKTGARDHTWRSLPMSFLEFHHDAIHFLGPSSFPEYLPAYLAAAVGRDRSLDQLPLHTVTALTRSTVNPDDTRRFDARISRLSAEQQRAVAGALAALESAHELEHNKRDVASALDSYWRNLAPTGDQA
jgi:hypothetical protein